MRLKRFKDLFPAELTQEQLDTLENKIDIEASYLLILKQEIIKEIKKYLRKNRIGFSEMARRMNSSSAQITRMKNGTANLTLASISQLAMLMGKRPKILFKNIKNKRDI